MKAVIITHDCKETVVLTTSEFEFIPIGRFLKEVLDANDHEIQRELEIKYDHPDMSSGIWTMGEFIDGSFRIVDVIA